MEPMGGIYLRPQVYRHELVAQGLPLPHEHEANIDRLLFVLNAIRFKSDLPMAITSGYRTKADHERIYLKKGVPHDRIPWGSYHLIGAAADVYDPRGNLKKWLNQNVWFLENLPVYIEDFGFTPDYVHFQIYPFRSYNESTGIFFRPY